MVIMTAFASQVDSWFASGRALFPILICFKCIIIRGNFEGQAAFFDHCLTLVITGFRKMANTKKSERILAKYERCFSTDIALITHSKKGLRPQAVYDFITLTQCPVTDIEKTLNKTLKTFSSYKKNQTSLDPVISEKLLKIFSLYAKGQVIFGNIEELNKWMERPAFGLGNLIPRELLDTITGIDLIAEELTRIAHGDLA